MMNYTICFTGHRELPADSSLKADVRQAVLMCLAHGGTTFRTGGARGFDALVGEVLFALKTEGHPLRWELWLPYPRSLTEAEEHADEVVSVSGRYHPGCMQKRDRALVDGCALCLAYLTKDTGGSAYTVAYAKKQGLQVIFLPFCKKGEKRGQNVL